ncbi:N-acetylneuraminate epimerase [Anatilimnocola aggregata]|uniref:N-acetylneuraminate epimerase n=1 Tax=Anatilimnocola aggregata TaxID=2528021 RepID=A0A517YMJ3_9BACT|nr:DUF3386 family protein [Anatilimnocola aggregata]QDU31442.1 N-acetylneuraminate epimerase [Anatilimnocola aggregata]
MLAPYRLPLHALLGLVLAWSVLPIADAAESAQALMDRAHHGRATWQKFPGFTADVTVSSAGHASTGTLAVSADGKIDLQLKSPAGLDWAQRSLNSIIGHRLADDQGATNVEFADEDTQHPFGRLLKSQDASEKSLWRVHGDVLTEVHRFHGDNHMVISVGDVARTAEGKHLPRSFSVTTWNTKTNAIVTARQVQQEWQRIQGVDLPVRILAAINKNDGSRTVEEITFSNHRLLGEVPVSTTTATSDKLPPLKVGVTSAGAAVADGHLYLYGGHMGAPHDYSADQQSSKFLRVYLSKPTEWEEVAGGPKRTGLALVGYRNQIYRVGGWESKNANGDKWLLYSSKDFARFDPKSGKWTDLAPMPRGRSSHDAAVIGNLLYVAGGWELNGEGDGDWHNTALVCDLSKSEPEWTEIAKPPFMRRALAVAGYRGKLYILGGMTDGNEMTGAVSVYDPETKTWSDGPALPGKGMETFGPSASGDENGLFATTGNGTVHRLADDGKSWVKAGELKHPRFFHRLVIADDGALVAVAGTARSGKVLETETIRPLAAGTK